MKHLVLLITVAWFGVALHGTEWQPCKDFLKAVRLVESSNGRFQVGDNGRSLGDFQLSEAAWLDVNQWRRARRLKTYGYDEAVFHAFINRVYASNYLTILHTELNRKLGREPTHAEIYAAYNMGLAMFAQCDFSLDRVNQVTRSKCQMIDEILSDKSSS